MDNDVDGEVKERIEAELEFVGSAYSTEEAWYENERDFAVHRRLVLEDELCVVLVLRIPAGYLIDSPLQLSCTVDSDTGRRNNHLVKKAWKAVPKLTEACRLVAEQCVGEEAVFQVLSCAEQWIQEEWQTFRALSEPHEDNKSADTATGDNDKTTPQSTHVVLGRRLIYSHHIISKVKRGNIHGLTSEFQLTGYMKIGWPGIILVEGLEDDCVAFYDSIRRWSWKFLVVRGEQQDQVRDVEANRKFAKFLEVQDMSIVAQHCRRVGLEALFRTSMKIYENDDDSSATIGNAAAREDAPPYGALCHVDHMNDSKGYRKWLRNVCRELGCCLLLKQCYPNHDYSKRPLIVVGLVGDKESIKLFLKRWRTSRVDTDSKGKPCLERMMTVLLEGNIPSENLSAVDWEKCSAEEQINVSAENVIDHAEHIGGQSWRKCLEESHYAYLSR